MRWGQTVCSSGVLPSTTFQLQNVSCHSGSPLQLNVKPGFHLDRRRPPFAKTLCSLLQELVFPAQQSVNSSLRHQLALVGKQWTGPEFLKQVYVLVWLCFCCHGAKKKKKESSILFRKRRACLISTLTATMFAVKLKSRGQPLTRQKSVSLVCVPLFKQCLFPCDEVPGPVQTPLNMTGAISAWHLITSGVFFCQNKSHLDFCLTTPNPKRTWTFQVSEWNVIVTFRNGSSLNSAGYCFRSLKLLGWSALSLRVRGCRA